MNGPVYKINRDEWYGGLYGELQSGGAQGWYVEKSHRALEQGLPRNHYYRRVLEVGGNEGEHLRFVQHDFDEYVLTDYRDTNPRLQDPRVTFSVADAQDLPFPDSHFDRVVVTCVLHHITDPSQALRQIRRVSRPNGVVSLTLPCDPGIMFRFAKRIGPYRSLSRRGIVEPEYQHYLEHHNHFPGILSAVRHVFSVDHIRLKYWPIPVPTWNANLFAIAQIRVTS